MPIVESVIYLFLLFVGVSLAGRSVLFGFPFPFHFIWYTFSISYGQNVVERIKWKGNREFVLSYRCIRYICGGVCLAFDSLLRGTGEGRSSFSCNCMIV